MTAIQKLSFVNTSLGLLLLACTLHSFVQSDTGSRRSQSQGPEEPTHGLCEPITIPLCKGIGYNQTFMPNMLGHETQTDAGLEVTTYHPLVKINCSPQLSLFLCALYLPVCTILVEPVPPCRSVCIAARDGCSDLMKRFGHNWPEHMACEKFPDTPELCVGPERTSSEEDDLESPKIELPRTIPDFGQEHTTRPPSPIRKIPNACPNTWKMERKRKYQLIFSKDDVLKDCGLPCHEVMFDRQQEEFARYWIGGWAILCFISTLFTVLTYLIDMRRFRYPERPIIFISGCYLVISLCYVVGFALEDKASCVTADGGASVITQGTKHEGCTILFMLTYFFTMASSIWWVILTLTWVLAAGLKWGHEAIESNSQYFHLAAWAVPAIKTITVIALGSIDGDVLSGICFTGLSDRTSLIGYIIAPLVAYLTLGTIFLVAGFISLFNIRNVIKHSGTKTNKLEKLMVRIGIFSVLYTVPAIIVIACNLYELLNRDQWLEQFRSEACKTPGSEGFIPCPVGSQRGGRPDFTSFIFKYLGYLIVGITSGFWIWSNKTMSSWASVFRKICCCCCRMAPREAAV
ncbi:frizzled-2-like [Watersipora subatra]|uniref:frizzled-2-like n=1 Tax=Watersipora subatra TaxID=2589382 RepID=UPI00355B76D5